MAIRLRAPCTPFWCELQRRAAATEIMMESNAPLSLLFSFAFLFRGVSNLLLTDWKQFDWIKPFRSTKYSIHVLYMDVMCVCVCARYWASFCNLFAIYSNWIQRAFVSILFYTSFVATVAIWFGNVAGEQVCLCHIWCECSTNKTCFDFMKCAVCECLPY